jgi:hypothetical protein
MNSVPRRALAIAESLLRLVGLDDASMDREEARLTLEYERFRALRAARVTEARPMTAWGIVVKARHALADFAGRRMSRALRDAKRWRPRP